MSVWTLKTGMKAWIEPNGCLDVYFQLNTSRFQNVVIHKMLILHEICIKFVVKFVINCNQKC